MSDVVGMKEVRDLRMRITLLGANEAEYAEAIESTERLEALLRNRQELEEALRLIVNERQAMGWDTDSEELFAAIGFARKLLEKGNE